MASTEELNALGSNTIFDASNNPQQAEILISATLHLMSHYSAEGGGLKLAAVIERHLQALSHAQGLAPVLRATCEQLSEQWAKVVARAIPQRQKRTWLSVVSLFS